MLTHSIDNISDLGGNEWAKIFEQLVIDFEKDIGEGRQLKQADLTPWVERELNQLAAKLERQRAEAKSQVDILTQQLKNIRTRKEEVNMDFKVSHTRVNATFQDMTQVNQMIEKANEMIHKA